MKIKLNFELEMNPNTITAMIALVHFVVQSFLR
jgi:hypothetical protein